MNCTYRYTDTHSILMKVIAQYINSIDLEEEGWLAAKVA